MEAMFKVSVPDGYNVFWEDFLEFLRKVTPGFTEVVKISVSGPFLSAKEQNDVFDRVYKLLDNMFSHYIQFGCVHNKVYCSLIPAKSAKSNGTTGVATCHEDDDLCYEYGCILAFARALKDESLESQILMCDPEAAEEYFKDFDFDVIY